MAGPRGAFLHVEVKGTRLELRVNDFPVEILRAPTEGKLLAIPAQAYVWTGENTVEATVSPGVAPSAAKRHYGDVPYEGVHMRARVVAFEEGVDFVPEAGVVLADLRLVPPPPGDLLACPQILQARFAWDEPVPAWAWASAPVLTLGERLVAEARTVIQSIAAALRRRDADAILELDALKDRELLAAHTSLPDEELEAATRQFVSTIDPKDDAVNVRAAEHDDFRLVAEGRVLHCVSDDWRDVIEVRKADGEIVPFALYLARIDGQLRVVR